ncbi:hypothetical protein [Paenibacillus andongensis]
MRPYDQATAGTRVSYSFDDETRVLTYLYQSSGDQSLQR